MATIITVAGTTVRVFLQLYLMIIDIEKDLLIVFDVYMLKEIMY